MPILKPTGLLQVPGLLGGRVTTIVFDQGYSVWTCPAGVTNLLTVYGIGAEGGGLPDFGSGDYWSVTDEVPDLRYGIFYTRVRDSTQSTESTTGELWSTLQAEVDAVVDAINAGGTGERDWTGGGGVENERRIRYVRPNNMVSDTPIISDGNTRNPLRIRGTASRAVTQFGEHKQSIMEAGGEILYSDVEPVPGRGLGWYVRVDCVREGRAAPDTTGFGFTFLGGQLSGSYPNTIILPPVPGSHANVAVTPGQDYAVMNRGTLIISYITP